MPKLADPARLVHAVETRRFSVSLLVENRHAEIRSLPLALAAGAVIQCAPCRET
jgi:hypothetical protein